MEPGDQELLKRKWSDWHSLSSSGWPAAVWLGGKLALWFSDWAMQESGVFLDGFFWRAQGIVFDFLGFIYFLLAYARNFRRRNHWLLLINGSTFVVAFIHVLSWLFPHATYRFLAFPAAMFVGILLLLGTAIRRLGRNASSGTGFGWRALFPSDWLVAIWWGGLLIQIWFAWDLSEFYSWVLGFILLPPEIVFTALGSVYFFFAAIYGCFRRSLRTLLLDGATALAALFLTLHPMVYALGSDLYLFRNQHSFLKDVEAVGSHGLAAGEGVRMVEAPSGRTVILEGDPPRFAFDLRQVGMFHLSGFFHDPSGAIEKDFRDHRTVLGRYSLIGLVKRWDHWYIATLMK